LFFHKGTIIFLKSSLMIYFYAIMSKFQILQGQKRNLIGTITAYYRY
jgi:hypothetical protein